MFLFVSAAITFCLKWKVDRGPGVIKRCPLWRAVQGPSNSAVFLTEYPEALDFNLRAGSSLSLSLGRALSILHSAVKRTLQTDGNPGSWRCPQKTLLLSVLWSWKTNPRERGIKGSFFNPQEWCKQSGVKKNGSGEMSFTSFVFKSSIKCTIDIWWFLSVVVLLRVVVFRGVLCVISLGAFWKCCWVDADKQRYSPIMSVPLQAVCSLAHAKQPEVAGARDDASQSERWRGMWEMNGDRCLSNDTSTVAEGNGANQSEICVCARGDVVS